MEKKEIYVIEVEEDMYRGDGRKEKWNPLDREKLKESMVQMAEYLSEAMAPLSKGFEEFHASEIEVGLQVSAEGSVGFLGTGASSKGNASVKIKFARKK